MRKFVVIDAEFDSLNPTKLWVVVCKDVQTKEKFTFRKGEFHRLAEFSRTVERWVGCNVINFDFKHLPRFVPGLVFDVERLIDLQVVSRTVFFKRPGGHSVEAFAEKYGMVKPPIDVYDDEDRIDEYVNRCSEDVEITFKMWEELSRFIFDKSWHKSLRVEHTVELICREMHDDGFPFNKDKASRIAAAIDVRLEELTNQIVAEVGDVEGAPEEYTLRRKKDGTPDARTLRLLRGKDTGFKHGDILRIPVLRPFNPGSPKDRVDYLNKCGWKPYVKTKTHLQAEREFKRAKAHEKAALRPRLERLQEYGWEVGEENLETLPKNAPEACKKLAEWLTLRGRQLIVRQWLAAYNERTGCIHPKFWHIGAWTHRMSHVDPNVGNIFGISHPPEDKDPADYSPVLKAKLLYDKDLRSCFCVEPGHLLVGTDAEGIQLRILASLMGDKDYINSVVNGDKKLGTDIHSVNMRALGLNHITRDDSKVFIYAFLLGAGFDKVASILRVTKAQAEEAVRLFLDRTPGLKYLKEEVIPEDAARGYFIGFDGRKVLCDNPHLMLAGYLQNGEKCIMAHSNVRWRKILREEKVPYSQVNFVHDEWQTKVPILGKLQYDAKGKPFCERSLYVGKVQREAIEWAGRDLGLSCPLAGATDIGFNWAETH